MRDLIIPEINLEDHPLLRIKLLIKVSIIEENIQETVSKYIIRNDRNEGYNFLIIELCILKFILYFFYSYKRKFIIYYKIPNNYFIR